MRVRLPRRGKEVTRRAQDALVWLIIAAGLGLVMWLIYENYGQANAAWCPLRAGDPCNHQYVEG